MSQKNNNNIKTTLPQEGTVGHIILEYLERCYGDFDITEKALEYYDQHLTAKALEDYCVCYQYYSEYFLRKFYEELWSAHTSVQDVSYEINGTVQ